MNMPSDPDRVQFSGPFSHHDVLIDGWRVPLIYAHPNEDGGVAVVIDERFACTFTRDEAQRFLPFLADAIAVALGYGAHPRDDDLEPLKRAPHVRPVRVYVIDGLESKDTDMDGTGS